MTGRGRGGDVARFRIGKPHSKYNLSRNDWRGAGVYGGEQRGHGYSLSLCQSAICLLGELHTSFQWLRADPVLFEPPNSRRPMTYKKNIKLQNKNSYQLFLYKAIVKYFFSNFNSRLNDGCGRVFMKCS